MTSLGFVKRVGISQRRRGPFFGRCKVTMRGPEPRSLRTTMAMIAKKSGVLQGMVNKRFVEGLQWYPSCIPNVDMSTSSCLAQALVLQRGTANPYVCMVEWHLLSEVSISCIAGERMPKSL